MELQHLSHPHHTGRVFRLNAERVSPHLSSRPETRLRVRAQRLEELHEIVLVVGRLAVPFPDLPGLQADLGGQSQEDQP